MERTKQAKLSPGMSLLAFVVWFLCPFIESWILFLAWQKLTPYFHLARVDYWTFFIVILAFNLIGTKLKTIFNG